MNSKYIKTNKKLVKSYTLYLKNITDDKYNKLLNSTKKLKNYTKLNLKRNLSFRQTLKNGFYKQLKHSWKKQQTTLFPNIIDKNTFNFSLKDENNEILRRTFNKNKENEKHTQYSNFAYKKEIEKIKAAKEFREKMKIIKNNLEIIKKNNLEEKKKMKELIMIRKMKKNKKESVKKDKIKIENQETYYKKLNIKNDKVMNKYREIMKKAIIKNNK